MSYCHFRILLCFWLKWRRKFPRQPATTWFNRWTECDSSTGQWFAGSRDSPRSRHRRWSWTRSWSQSRLVWRPAVRWPFAGRRAAATLCRWSRRWPLRARGCPRPCSPSRSRPRPQCDPSPPCSRVCGLRTAVLRSLLSKSHLASRRRWHSICCCP